MIMQQAWGGEKLDYIISQTLSAKANLNKFAFLAFKTPKIYANQRLF